MQEVFVSWSGGKDSCLSGYLAAHSNFKVSHLLNMVTGNGQRSRSHGLSPWLLRLQAEALGIPILQHRATRANYETEFKKALARLRQQGINDGVFGDIDFNAHREWIDRVCREARITPHFPLWERPQDDIMQQLIASGFTAIIVAVKADIFDEDILGRKVDYDFLQLLSKLGQTRNITPCGEAGEYHSLVVDGPWFQRRLEIRESRKILRGERRFLKILGAELRDK